MANKRIKDISTASTSFASDDFVITDSATSGTRKMTKDNLISQVSAGVSGDYLEESNNLSDVASKDTAKLNLEIPSVGSGSHQVPTNGHLGTMSFQDSRAVTVDDLTVDGHFTGTVGKPMPVNGPSMRFDGVDDHVSFAAPVGSAFSFTNSTDDTPFTVTGWVKMEADAFDYGIVSKYGSSTSTQEWTIYTSSSGKLVFTLKDGGGDYVGFETSDAMTEYIGQYIYLTVTYAGAGPNSGNAFGSAFDGMSFFINGKPTLIVELSSGTYSGMSSTAQAVTIGRSYSATFSYKGEIRDVKLFNKELSAAEVKELYSNGQLGFAESRGAITYVSDFSADSLDGWTDGNGTADATSTVGGDSDNIQLTLDGSTSHHYLQKAGLGFIGGKTFKIEFDVFFPSSNSVVDELALRYSTSGSTFFYTGSLAKNTWVRFSTNVTWPTGSNIIFRLNAADNGSLTGDDAAGESFALRNIRITQIGSVLDARAENYNQSAGKLLDVSGNDFVGTQSGGVELLTPRSHLSAATLDLTNLPTTASGLSAGEVYNDSGTLKIV